MKRQRVVASHPQSSYCRGTAGSKETSFELTFRAFAARSVFPFQGVQTVDKGKRMENIWKNENIEMDDDAGELCATMWWHAACYFSIYNIRYDLETRYFEPIYVAPGCMSFRGLQATKDDGKLEQGWRWLRATLPGICGSKWALRRFRYKHLLVQTMQRNNTCYLFQHWNFIEFPWCF